MIYLLVIYVRIHLAYEAIICDCNKLNYRSIICEEKFYDTICYFEINGNIYSAS